MDTLPVWVCLCLLHGVLGDWGSSIPMPTFQRPLGLMVEEHLPGLDDSVEARLGPEFFQGSFGRSPLYMPPGKFEWLPSALDCVTENLARSDSLRQLTTVRRQEGKHQQNGLLNHTLSEIQQELNKPGTSFVVQLGAFEQDFAKGSCMQQLIAFKHQMKKFFRSPVSFNVYISGPNATALEPHTDLADGFVLQLQGRKSWQLCFPSPDVPRDPRFNYTLADLAEMQETLLSKQKGCTTYQPSDLLDMNCQTVIMERGALLYVPKGVVHRAREREGHFSVHLTIGLRRDGLTFQEMVQAALPQRELISPPLCDIDWEKILQHAIISISSSVNGIGWRREVPLWMVRADGTYAADDSFYQYYCAIVSDLLWGGEPFLHELALNTSHVSIFRMQEDLERIVGKLQAMETFVDAARTIQLRTNPPKTVSNMWQPFENLLDHSRALLTIDGPCVTSCNNAYGVCYNACPRDAWCNESCTGGCTGNCTTSCDPGCDAGCTTNCTTNCSTCYAFSSMACPNACNGTLQTCLRGCHHCGFLSLPSGSISYTNSDKGDSVANHTCNGGYALQGGTTTRTCSPDTGDTWIASPARTCQGNLCLGMASPPNGFQDLPSPPSPVARYPWVLNFGCNQGYSVGGYAKAYCGWDGQWYRNNQSTTNPPTPGQLYQPGDTSCNDINECNNVTNPPCSQICANNIGGYVCSCNQGYYLSGQSLCVGSPCANLGALPNGIWRYTLFNGSTVVSNSYDCNYPCSAALQCNTGLAPYNVASQTCLNTLVWSADPSTTICIGALCNRTYPVSSTTFTTSVATSWQGYTPPGRYQDQVSVTCKQGYSQQSGDFLWTCLANGNWDCGGNCDWPICQGQPCDTPPIYQNGLASTTNGGRYPSVCTYNCNPGYDQTGAPGGINCVLPGLNWANTNPFCTGKNCGSPGNSTSTTMISFTGPTFPTTANYRCNQDYYTAASLATSCQVNGSWPPAPPCYYRIITGVNPSPNFPNTAARAIIILGTFSENASYTINRVTYGPPNNPTFYFCTVTGQTATTINCNAPTGVGGGLTVQVDILTQVAVTSGPVLIVKPGFINYPAPTMSNTINVTYNDLSTSSENTQIVLKSTLGGDVLTITGTNFGTAKQQVYVIYGDSCVNGPFYQCAVQTVTDTKITCTIPQGDSGPHYFQVGVGFNTAPNGEIPSGPTIQWTPRSTISLRYPIGPTISTVRGCVPYFEGTSSCPTKGGINITITGGGFLGGSNTTADKPIITVAGDNCNYVNHTQSIIICTIPRGTGLNQLVAVITNQGITQRTLLGYEAPTVATVTGCDTASNLDNCYRTGGQTLTFTGLNFGYCCASVIVGDAQCDTVQHDPDFPHEKLTCNLPPSKGLDKALILQQDRGQYVYLYDITVSYAQCQPGTFDEPYPSLLCTLCSPGTYGDTIAMTSCKACEAGTYQSLAGQTNCSLARTSYYAPNRSMTMDLPCPPGSFSTSQGRASCPLCDGGKYSPGSGFSVCTSCQRGRQQELQGQSSCKPCQNGTYAPTTGQYLCTVCPPGQTQPAQGALSCIPCGLGRISSSPLACVDCPVGRYADRTGLADCDRCQSGFYQDVAATSFCQSCSPGRYAANPESTICLYCEVGKYQQFYQQPTCVSCSAGTVSNVTGSPQCRACAPGQRAPLEGMAACLPCDPGSANPIQSQVDCALCTRGTIAALGGLTTCNQCGAGTIAPNDGMSACTQCLPGQYAQSIGLSTCSACELGFAAVNAGSIICTACVQGKFAPALGTPLCLDCIAGTFSENLQASGCKQCDPGRSSSIGSRPSNCDICPGGKYTRSPASLTCDDCTSGFFQANDGATLCEQCRVGTYTAVTGTTRCTDCEPGRYSATDGVSSCTNCAAGTQSPATGATVCDQCIPGRFAAILAATTCTTCSAGRFVVTPGMSSCADCLPGRYSTDPVRCVMCDPGKYADSYAQSKCDDCAAGNYANGNGLSICPPCPPGQITDHDGLPFCSPCLPGTYTPFNGSSFCSDCAPGTAAPDAGMELCRVCDSGKYAAGNGVVNCADCVLGSSQNFTGQTFCDKCGPGLFADRPGMAVCNPCPQGRSTDGLNVQSLCLPCIPGKHNNLTGQALCVDCEVGRYVSTPGSANCSDCSPGSFASSPGTSVCPFCQPGRYSTQRAAIFCLDCPIGTQATGPGLPECEPCTPGKFANIGASRCALCKAGKVNNENQSSICDDCPVGKYAPGDGLTGCADCGLGTMANSPGQEQCAYCPPGKYTNTTASENCNDCFPGKYQQSQMSTGCDECNIGSFSRNGQSICDDCPSQYAQPYAAQPACLRCDDEASQSELRDECVCNPGFYAPVRLGPSQPNLPCEGCPRGANCDTKGTTFGNIGSAYGYWREDASKLIFYQCQMPDHCPGGNVSTCGQFRTGALCGFCIQGYAASGTGGLGQCSPCNSEGESAATLVVVSIAVIVVVFILYWIVLYSDRKMLTKLKEKQKANTTELKQDYEQVDSSAFENFEEGIEKLTNRASQERLRPNPVYKLKIVLGFFQIMSNLAVAIGFGWPVLYREFLQFFSFLNMDFMPWGSLSCLAPVSYETKLIIITATPVALFALLICLYVLPKLYKDMRDMSDNDDLRNRRERSRIKFIKLCLFTVFAMFPFIASSVVKLWVCKEIDGKYYLLSDMGIECYGEEWTKMMPLGIILILVYPVGIPVTFFIMLVYFRKRFKDPDVRIRLGFIYAAYTDENWWFELYDIASKLYLTSLVVFFADGTQYLGVLIWLGIYIIVVLVRKPFITKGDDRLQLFSILEIYLLVSCAMVLKANDKQMDPILDTFLSICLIILTLLIAVGGFLMVGRNLRKMYFERKRKQLIAKGLVTDGKEEYLPYDETAEEQVLSWATKVRLRAVQLPKKLVAAPKAPPRKQVGVATEGGPGAKPLKPTRKTADGEEVKLVAHAHRAPDRYGGRVLAAVQSFEAKAEELIAKPPPPTRRNQAPPEYQPREEPAKPVDPFAAAPSDASPDWEDPSQPTASPKRANRFPQVKPAPGIAHAISSMRLGNPGGAPSPVAARKTEAPVPESLASSPSSPAADSTRKALSPRAAAKTETTAPESVAPVTPTPAAESTRRGPPPKSVKSTAKIDVPKADPVEEPVETSDTVEEPKPGRPSRQTETEEPVRRGPPPKSVKSSMKIDVPKVDESVETPNPVEEPKPARPSEDAGRPPPRPARGTISPRPAAPSVSPDEAPEAKEPATPTTLAAPRPAAPVKVLSFVEKAQLAAAAITNKQPKNANESGVQGSVSTPESKEASSPREAPAPSSPAATATPTEGTEDAPRPGKPAKITRQAREKA